MKTIVLCASMAFYKHVNDIADELEAKGYRTVVPELAAKMRVTGDYSDESRRTWLDNPEDFKVKARLMHAHFDKVAKGDAILVVNDEKHGIAGYIGPNVLMEMGLAFHLNKPIYVLNPVTKEMPVYEEVLGMGSILLDGDINKFERV